MRHWNRRRLRAFVRLVGPRSLLFRRRLAITSGAVMVGLAALVFALLADAAASLFGSIDRAVWWLPLILTPAGFAAIVWFTRRFSPEAAGSGIPQVMAATSDPTNAHRRLVAVKTVTLKGSFTLLAQLVGASVGREGPTVQISAAIMIAVHRLLQVPIRASVLIAGGAAGVAAAFNTPLAGVAFAIEELAAAYEQRMTLLVMAAILVSGMVSLGIAGDYLYFGVVTDTLEFAQALVVAPMAGICGGLAGGLFARGLLIAATATKGPIAKAKSRPVLFATGCGIVVGIIGVSTGTTWGTGYEAARGIINGDPASVWFGPAKFVATVATAVSGLPGGIFAPSLATGAGFGRFLQFLFPSEPVGPVILLGMVAYFTGVVRAPLTAVIIISETTGARGLMLPLLAAAITADASAAMVCKERLYHGLSKSFTKKS